MSEFMDDVDPRLVELMGVVVPDLASLPPVAAAVAELVARSAIRILDLVVVTRRSSDDAVSILDLDDIPDAQTRECLLSPAGRLLSDTDIALATATLLPDSACLLLLVEDRWAGPLSSAAGDAGGHVVAGQRIPRARITVALASRAADPAVGPWHSGDPPNAGRAVLR
jgi:hypothetical protein